MTTSGADAQVPGRAGLLRVPRHSFAFRQLELRVRSEMGENCVSKPRASDCAWGLGVFLVGLGLNLYTPGEVVASVVVSSILILALGVLLTSVFLIWRAANSVATWARIAPRNSTLLASLAAERAGQ